MRANEVTHYHSHLTYGIVFGAFLSIPRVYTHHNITPRVNRLTYKVLTKFVDRQVGISKICGDMLYDYSGKNVVVINNGVDMAKFFNCKPREISPEEIIQVVCVGALSEQKNYPLLIASIERLPAGMRKRFQLTIAGEGGKDLTEALLQQIKQAELQNTVNLLGNCSDVPGLLSDSHLFLMSSSWEGLPIALIEATMSGLPCMVTDVGGCSEVISICENGVVVEPENPDGYARALERMLAEPAIMEEYSERAIKNRGKYSIEYSINQHRELYISLFA